MPEVISVNGINFIFNPFSRRETASLGIFLEIGSRIEAKSVKGIAHFVEHMVFKGTRNYTCSKIKQEIEGRGGSLNAFTSKEITAYYAHFLKHNLFKTLDILVDMAFEPLFRPEDIEREKKVILEEIKMYNDLPSSRGSILLDRLLWEKHPLGEEIIGYTETVKNINQKKLSDFKGKYYIPSNMVVSFSGDFSKGKIVERLKRKIKPFNRKTRLKFTAPLPCKGLHIAVEKKELEQTHLCLGFRSISYLDPERLVVQLINVILGANMSSRLFEELREKRSLCYDISTEVKKYRDSGGFMVHVGLDKSKVLVAIRTILKELKKLKEKDVSAAELLRAKDYFLGQIAMSLERPQGMMFFSAESFITLGKIYSYAAIKQEIEKITPSEIKKAANKLFKFPNLSVSCVGNVDNDLEDKIKGLRIEDER